MAIPVADYVADYAGLNGRAKPPSLVQPDAILKRFME
jgi:hypothetical protein